MHPVTYAALFAVVAALYFSLRRKTTSYSLPLPPGPKPLPLIGNVHQAPKSHAWRDYTEWAKIYGPVFYMNMLGQDVVIASTAEAAHELLTKKGAISSDRPRLFVSDNTKMEQPLHPCFGTSL